METTSEKVKVQTHTHTPALLRRNVHSRSRDSSCLPASKHFLPSSDLPKTVPQPASLAAQRNQLSGDSYVFNIHLHCKIQGKSPSSMYSYTNLDCNFGKSDFLWFQLFVEIKTCFQKSSKIENRSSFTYTSCVIAKTALFTITLANLGLK